MKNVVRKLDEAINSKSRETASEELKQAVSVIEKTAAKGVIHRNTASRKISRLTRKVNAL
jgi:small subunit ribosomal protein S20